MSIYYLSLGSNLGDRGAYLKRANEFLSGLGEVVKKSSIIETLPRGMSGEAGKFLNMACMLRSGLEPLELLHEIKMFEARMGRDIGNSHYQPRTIDIDILMVEHPDRGPLFMETPELTIPHKEMAHRLFVLKPLSEIAPNAIHPLSNRTVEQLLRGYEG